MHSASIVCKKCPKNVSKLWRRHLNLLLWRNEQTLRKLNHKKDTASSMWSLQISHETNSKLRTHMRRSHPPKAFVFYSLRNQEFEFFRSLREKVSSSIACVWKVICPNHRVGAIIPISGHQLLLHSPITTTVASSNPFVSTNLCKQHYKNKYLRKI